MNHRAFHSNFVTQNSSDESEEEINPRLFNRSRIAANLRRNRVTNHHMNTIPDDVDPLTNNSSTINPPSSSDLRS